MTDETVERCPLCDRAGSDVFDPVAHLRRCGRCRFVFVSPRPSSAALTRFYSAPTKYDGWLAEETERQALWRRRLRIVARHGKPGSLLDVGTGTGQFLVAAGERFEPVYGTEISDSAVRIARDRYGLEIFHGDLDAVDFGNRTFANISLFHILEHVPEPARLLRACSRLLKDDGRIFVAVPNDLLSWKLRITTLWKRRRGRLPADTGRSGIPRLALNGALAEIHLCQFTPRTLRYALDRAGFHAVRMTLDPFFVASGTRLGLHMVYYWTHRVMASLSGANRYDTILAVGRKT